MGAYVAPYLISQLPPNVPTEGTFTVPVCTTPQRFRKIQDALFQKVQLDETPDYDHLIDWLDACTRIVEGCVPSQAVCRTIALTDSRVTWFPESPYEPLPDIPDGYLFHPWTIVDSGIIASIISVWGLGYKVGDVFTDVTKFPIFTGWSEFLSNYANLPRMTITVTGTGEIKLHLLNIVQGGRLILVKDGSFNLINLGGVELDKDLSSYPNENQTEIIIPVEFTTDGEHILDCVFAPVVDIDLIPLKFGGGIRAIELCGFGVGAMPDDPCCPDEISAIETTNDRLQKIINLLEGGATIDLRFNGGSTPPDLTGGDCAPAFFDHDDGETDPEVLQQRTNALCITIERYVKAVLLAALRDMGAPDILVDYIGSGIPQTVPLSLSKIVVVYPSILEGLAAFFDALSGGFELNLIVCMMLSALQGDENNTFTNFKNALSDLSAMPEALGVPLVGLVNSTNGVKNNYLAFNQALQDANDEDLSTFECPCEDAIPTYCSAPLDLTVWGGEFGGSATVITLVAPDIYHITNSTAEAGTYYAAIKEASGRCLKFDIPEGYTYQPVQSYYSRGCCDDADGSAISGDFSGNHFEGVQWNAVGDVPIDTYVKITCEDCCTEIPLEDFAGTGCSIIYMGNCLYRFNNTTPTHIEGHEDVFYMSFRAVDGSCLHVINSDDPDFPTQGVGTDTTMVDCDDVETNFVGGFTPSDLKSVKWFGGHPTYFKITLA